MSTKAKDTVSVITEPLRVVGGGASHLANIWTQWILIVVMVAVAAFVGYSTGTLRTRTPIVAASTTGTQLDLRLEKLDLQYAALKDSLERSIKQYENLLTYFAVIVSLMVGFQAYLAQRQSNREEARQQTQDVFEREGVERVSKILDVLRKTLKVRLTTEQEIESFRQNSVRINLFLETQQVVIKKQREGVEKAAKTLSEVRRQMFRTVVLDLEEFARNYDSFVQQYAELEEDKGQGVKFSGRAEYIRGIAAHFANKPSEATRHLGIATAQTAREEDETLDSPFRKRKASAYYYIGVNLANINDSSAIDEFRSAIEVYPDSTDFLSRIVLAEALGTQGRISEANSILGPEITDWDKSKDRIADEVELGLMKKSMASNDPVYRRLLSRVTLIRVNMLLNQDGARGKEDALRMLEAIWGGDEDVEKDFLSRRDRTYYYATSTLGQLSCLLQGPDTAAKYFDHAHMKIIESYDLRSLTEVRSRILLRLVAAICALHGTLDKGKAEGYLVEAQNQLELLPKLNGKTCTVFSPLSRRNEPPETILLHLQAIRSGEVLQLTRNTVAQ